MKTVSKTVVFSALVCAVLALGACGSSRSDRALSGAGIGAGIGALGGAVTGGSPWTGAIVGGAAGAATGAMTDKDDINFD